jgi:tRNA U34 5-methylaminomethyl-2-thiouridine-forming methyltransferase MnmC
MFKDSAPQITDDGSYTLMHPQLKETFHSHSGARQESQLLYVNRSGLDQYMHSKDSGGPIRVLDVGLGLGYNALTTITQWHNTPAPPDLQMLSLEIELELIELLTTSKGAWMINWDENWKQIAQALQLAEDLSWSLSLPHHSGAGTLKWKILCQDASQLTAEQLTTHLGGPFDYCWQDPFSPSNNPVMWSDQWFRTLLQASAAKAELMSYSVARSVKQSLTRGGWKFEIIEGSGRKRHWLRANPQ